jgi:hypothetical protein
VKTLIINAANQYGDRLARGALLECDHLLIISIFSAVSLEHGPPAPRGSPLRVLLCWPADERAAVRCGHYSLSLAGIFVSSETSPLFCGRPACLPAQQRAARRRL